MIISFIRLDVPFTRAHVVYTALETLDFGSDRDENGGVQSRIFWIRCAGAREKITDFPNRVHLECACPAYGNASRAAKITPS